MQKPEYIVVAAGAATLHIARRIVLLDGVDSRLASSFRSAKDIDARRIGVEKSYCYGQTNASSAARDDKDLFNR